MHLGTLSRDILKHNMRQSSLMNCQRYQFLCRLVLVSTFVGCGESRLPTHPVEGKVLFSDGQPLPGAVVEFQSLDPAAGQLNARGLTAADGTYRLTTYVEGDGAIAGEHAVIVVPPPYDQPSNMSGPPPKEVLNRRFADYSTSGLKFEVQPGKNTFPITVERP